MKNIIYGLGQHFWNNVEFLSSVIEDTIALCDADTTKLEYLLPLNLPLIAPEQIQSTISNAGGNIKVYICTTNFYNDIFDILTQKLKIPPEDIAPLPTPEPAPLKLLSLKRNFFMGGPPVPIRADAFDSAILLPDRADALNYMPKNGIVAEVGVAYGDFSRKIIDALSPQKFYAIDYFHKNNPLVNFWGRDDFIKDNMPHQQWYENRFKAEIEYGVLETRQGLSWDCLAQFPDNYFDYVYLDAAHDYHSVRKDIMALCGKMKDCGFIQFNDYCERSLFGQPFGVINAVNSFVNSGKHRVKYFCLSSSPKFVGKPDIVVQLHKTD